MAADKLPFSGAPPDVEGLPDMHLALYNEAVVFDQATKLVFVCVWAHLGNHPSVQHAYMHARQRLTELSSRIAAGPPHEIPPGKVHLPSVSKTQPEVLSYWGLWARLGKHLNPIRDMLMTN